jgi:hypothetical protein
MRLALQIVGLAAGLPLELLIIAALLRGEYRRLPFVFVYTIVDFLITVVEIFPAFDYVRGIQHPATKLASLYWIDEVVEQVLIYAVVMSLIYGATRTLRSRRVVRLSLLLGAVLIAGVSFFAHYNPALNPGEWMTPWTRDLNFCSAILDLGLWALLIGSRKHDHQVLLLSGALGIKFAGESIGESVRQLAIRNRSRSVSLTGSVVMMLADVFFLYVWWQALRNPRTSPALACNREASAPTTS